MNEPIKQLMCSYRDMLEDCKFEPDIMCEEAQLVRKLKYIINKRLSVEDKTLILLYADYDSLRKLAGLLGVSHVTVKNRIAGIRRDILSELDKLEGKDL